MRNVRTTAYSHGERAGGPRNAVGEYLSGRHVLSAASDWSRFPLGTRFRVVGTKEEYIIDDYGTALIGTNTIDLYKPSRLEMKRWGVRHVDIDILQWGSSEQSLKVLHPRKKHSTVRRMIAGLEKKGNARPALD
jgi:3D (Asp-Asp-Asp) domain-containing protein